jgi:beta-lactamase regulating signal transducer with metallopeptidase domain
MSALLLRGLESTFAWILEASWQASVLAALVLLLQWAFRGKLNPRWHHALWLLVVARLLLPVLPESALSIFQFAPAPPPAIEQTMTEPIFRAPPVMPVLTTVTAPAPPPPQYPFSAFTALALFWLAGALGLLLMTWAVNRRFARHVSSASAVTDSRLLQLADAARHELGIRRAPRIIESAQVQNPAIMGLLRPTLILPKAVLDRFTDKEMRFIFLHEFAHLKRGDLFLQWLIALLQIVHWFNLVLWYTFRRMRIDREPATDALVLSRTGEEQKDSYGHVLVKLLQHYHARHAFPTLVGILEDKDQFKRRFSLIARFTRGAYGWSLLGVLLIGVLSVACLTKGRASENATSPTQSAVQESAAKVAEVTGKSSVVMIRIAPRIVQIDEDDYEAHRADIDKAVQRGDVTPLSTLKSYNLLSSLAVLTKSGEQGVLEAVRVLPTAFEKEPDGTFKPTDFKRQNLGVRFVVFPTFLDGTINFKGDLNITSLERWTQTEENPHKPVFHVREAPVSELIASGQTKGFEVPGGAQMEPADPAFCFLPDKVPDASKNPKALRRIFLFLNLQAFHDGGRPMTSQPVENAPTAAPANTESFTVRTFLAPAGFFKTTPADHADVRPELIAHGIAFPANTTAIYVSIGTIDLAAAGKIVMRNTPEHLDKLAALIETAANAAPVSNTSVLPVASFQNVTISGKLQLVQPKDVDLNKSIGYLQSVDGGSTEFYFQPDGSFALPNVKPEVYNRHIHFVPADPALAAEAFDMTLAPLTVDGSAARITTNLDLAVGFAKLPKGNIEIGLKVIEISDDAYLANKTKIDAAVEKADIGFFNNLEGVSLLSAPSVSTPPGTKANIDIVREFPYPIKFDPAIRVSNSSGATVTVPITPTDFATKDVGVRVEITPTINAANSPEPPVSLPLCP